MIPPDQVQQVAVIGHPFNPPHLIPLVQVARRRSTPIRAVS